jgi:methylglutaconyl-CoA hydratase
MNENKTINTKSTLPYNHLGKEALFRKNLIEVNRDGAIVNIVLNRPERHNALTLELLSELDEVLTNVMKDESLLFVILSGNGRSFCAGADLNWFYNTDELTHEESTLRYQHLADLLLKIYRLPQITIAAVRGNVFGGGIGLMAVCDFVIAENNSRFMFSELKLGLLPATIMPFVAKRLSLQNQRKWILNGALFQTDEAGKAGLVDICCETGQLQQATSNLISTFSEAAPAALKKAKMMINKVSDGTIGVDDTKITAGILAEALLSPEGKERIGAFIEKRIR